MVSGITTPSTLSRYDRLSLITLPHLHARFGSTFFSFQFSLFSCIVFRSSHLTKRISSRGGNSNERRSSDFRPISLAFLRFFVFCTLSWHLRLDASLDLLLLRTSLSLRLLFLSLRLLFLSLHFLSLTTSPSSEHNNRLSPGLYHLDKLTISILNQFALS